MQRYNIALLPVDPAVQEGFIALSRRYFLAHNDDYILGPEGLAHVTLCQFKTETPETAQSAFEGFKAAQLGEIAVKVTEFRIRAGTLANAGKFIAEFMVGKDPALMAYQAACAAHLDSAGIKTLTPVETYSPHFTMARLAQEVQGIPGLGEAPQTVVTMRLALGFSTESGVFVREI